MMVQWWCDVPPPLFFGEGYFAYSNYYLLYGRIASPHLFSLSLSLLRLFVRDELQKRREYEETRERAPPV